MSFRRSKSHAAEERRWSLFTQAHERLIHASGLTGPTVETEERFADFLMHGYLDHHPDASQFAVGQMNDVQYRAFLDLVDRYFSAGYPDPGLACFRNLNDAAWIFRNHPDQLGGYLRYVCED